LRGYSIFYPDFVGFSSVEYLLWLQMKPQLSNPNPRGWIQTRSCYTVLTTFRRRAAEPQKIADENDDRNGYGFYPVLGIHDVLSQMDSQMMVKLLINR
jgi:hypothetical protein